MRVMRIALLLVVSSFLMTSFSQAASIDIVQKGISGSLSSNINLESFSNDTENSNIYLGTQLGIYIFSPNGSLINFIQTGSSVTNIISIPDINNNGYEEIIFTTTNTYFSNVLCYDSYNNEKLWEFSSETEVFDMDMLWTMKQVSVFDLEISESGDKVYLTAGYNVYCLDSNTGDILASFEGTDNLWDITVIQDDIVVGDQNGYVYRLDGDSLDLVWKKLVSKSYTVINPSTKSSVGTVARSVWDIVPLTVDSKQLLAASCEDGRLYTLDFETSDIQNSLEIIDYVDSLLYNYYNDNPLPTSSVDYNFLNNRVITIPDVTEDGDTDLLVYTYPGSRTGNEYQGAQMGIYIVDSSNLNIEIKNENFDLTKITKIETITSKSLEDTYVLLPSGKSSSYEKVKLISLDDCSAYKTISINSTSGSSSSNSYYVKSLENDSFILSSNYGDVLKSDLNGNISWIYPRLLNIELNHVDLVGTNINDLLVQSVEGLDDRNSIFEEGSSRVIYVLDGDTKDIAWSYEMSYEEYLNTTGLQGVQTFDDVNNDGKTDIVAFKQRSHEWGSGDEYGVYTRLIVFSGNGAILYEKQLTNSTYYGIYEQYMNNPSYVSGLNQDELEWIQRDRRIRKTIESLDIISDVSGDEISDFIIGSWNEVYILNSTSGEIIWTRTYNKGNYDPPGEGSNPMDNYEWDWIDNDRLKYYSLGDHNLDGYDELLQVSWDEMNILRSATAGSSFDYTVHKEITFSNGNFNQEELEIVDDMNGDSFKDIICNIHIQDSPSVYKVISGDDGTEIIEIERDDTAIDLVSADFDGDSKEDSIIFSDSGSGPKIEVISGDTNEVIWNYLGYEESWMLRESYGSSNIMPACYVDDINGDDVFEIAIGRSLPWDAGAEVLVYDVQDNTLLKTINVETIDPDMDTGDMRWQPSVVTAHLSDLTGDDIGEIAVVMSLGESSQKQLKLVVIDVAEEEIICDYIAKGTKVEDFGDMIVTYGTGGELYLLNPGKNISIISPRDGGSVSSPLSIAWSEGDNETVKIVKVNNKNIMKVSGDSTVFDLKSGNRKISIYAFDKYGKGTYANVDVDVQKTSSAETSLIAIFVILLFVLFIPKLISIFLKKSSSIKKFDKNVDSKEGG